MFWRLLALRNPRHPDYSGLDIVISAPVNAVGRASTTKFNSWVTDRLKERAAIWKQERVYREEQKQSGPAAEQPRHGSRAMLGGPRVRQGPTRTPLRGTSARIFY